MVLPCRHCTGTDSTVLCAPPEEPQRGIDRWVQGWECMGWCSQPGAAAETPSPVSGAEALRLHGQHPHRKPLRTPKTLEGKKGPNTEMLPTAAHAQGAVRGGQRDRMALGPTPGNRDTTSHVSNVTSGPSHFQHPGLRELPRPHTCCPHATSAPCPTLVLHQCLSPCHHPHPTPCVWSTIPGQLCGHILMSHCPHLLPVAPIL